MTNLSHIQLQQRDWIRGCRVSDLVEDEGLRLSTTPPVSVYSVDGSIYCIDDTCSHENFSLADGWVDGCVVECALHMAKFDLRTGEPLTPPASRPVRTHETRVSGEFVELLLPTDYDVTALV